MENAEYRLVYAGEILEGQHKAVVRKRLSRLLKLDDERTEILFSGKAVVVKKAADEKTATRYRTAFEKAGARLQVLSLGEQVAEGGGGERREDAATTTESSDGASGTESAAEQGSLQALAPGTDILREDEKAQVEVVEVDTSHLSVQGAVFVTDEPAPEIAAPNVDHLTLAEPGTPLSSEQADDEIEEILDVDFDLADAGADIGPVQEETPPAAPDTSHIKLEDH